MADDGQYDSQINLEQEEYEQETTIEQEDSELEITMQPEAATVYGGSVVNSINGQVGDVILTTSDLENTSDYQTGAQVQSAIAGKQDKLTAGTNIQINNDVISATDTTYSAGSGLDLDGTTFSVDTNTIATVQDVSNEATTRENSDANLQGQIDALTVSSDVIDVLGTYQELQNYDTTHVKENDIIKVLQDSTHNNAMSYYRWVVTDNIGAWVYVGSEGPYYTKSEADALLNDKQNIEDNSLDTTRKTIVGAINEVNSIAKGSNQALSFANYSAMVTEFNSLAGNEYNVGQNIMIVTLEVPDLWISGIESTSSTYTYTTDEAFTTALVTNGYVQVGYYKLSALETQKVDLTNYVTTTDYASNATGGVLKVTNVYGIGVSASGELLGAVVSESDYPSMWNDALVSKGTLENVITGKGLVSKTDYASNNTGGVVKTNTNYGTSVDSNGSLRGTTKTYADYGSMHNLGLISKVTLENVITGKGLVSNTSYATDTVGGVIKTSSGNYATSLSNGQLSSLTKTYQDYTNARDQMFIGKGTLENVITGKGLNISSINSGENINITNLLPNGYTRLEYIESSGTQYIDPGIASSNTIGINIDYSYPIINSSTNAGVCGILQGNEPRTDSLFISTNIGKTNGNLFFAHRGVTSSTDIHTTANKIYNVKINWRNSGVIDFGERTINVGTNNAASGAIRLFGRKSGSSYTYASLKMYSCQFSDETKMIRNLIPAKRNSDSVIGMYDTVNGVFYGNKGTGTFTAGAELDNIPKINFKNEDGYVTNTDYGSFTTAGVVKASSTYGTQFASTGAMYAQTKTYEQYTNSTSPGLFVGRGTLENVITGKGLDLKQLSTFDSTKTQILKNINGSLIWVDE